MQSNDQKITIKCKPLTALTVQSSNSPSQKNTARRSTRIISRANNENEMEGSQQPTSYDDDVNGNVRKRKVASKRRSQSRIESTDEDDVFVPEAEKKRSPTKRRTKTNGQSDVVDTSAPKIKTPKKRRKPLLTIKCSKITDFFGKSTATTTASTAADKIEEDIPCVPVSVTPPSDVIVLSSSEEPDSDNVEEQTIVRKPQPVGQQQPSVPLNSPDRKKPYPNNVEEQPIVEERQPSHQQQQVASTSPLRKKPAPDNIKEQSIVRKSQPFHQQQPQVALNSPQRKWLKVPDYKIVDGTSFAVDAFRFGDIDGVTTYFLTHFHSDHYNGLNRKFNQPIYMSTITGRLVKAILKVDGRLIKTMDINTSYVIDGVEVTPIDANHCPGAVMFIFKLPCGRTILHTGDFRATPEMESNPIFWNNNISTIYLDTTYLHKSYNFGTQNDALLLVEDEIRKFKLRNVGKKFVILVGSYLVGKERVWSHIAQTFNMKVWLEPERRKAFDLIYAEENDNQTLKKCVRDKREEADLHVIPMHCVNYKFLMDYLKDSKHFQDHVLLAFRATGWAQNAKPQYGSRISIVGVHYSEHSSYSELERFVRFVQPKTVISTVPISSGNSNTKKVPANWLSAPKPMKSSQSTLTSFMKLRKSSCTVNDKLTEISQNSGHNDQQQQPVIDDAGSYGADSMETDYMP